MTTSAALRVAPTSSTALNTNACSFSRSSSASTVAMVRLSSSSLTPPTLRPAAPTSPRGPHLVRHLAPSYYRTMLLGREPERHALAGVLDDARRGQSAVLALVGEPGIGKSALLDDVAGRAEGMRVLRARGVATEAQIPFAALYELVRPALGSLASIPTP